MKFASIIVLLILITGILCPSHLTVTRTDGEPCFVSLNVCDPGGPALSVDSKSPALDVSHSPVRIMSGSELTFREYGQFYKYISATDLFIPPCV